MKASTQLLVLCGLAGVLLAIGAYEAGRPEADPKIIDWARGQAQRPPWSGSRDVAEDEDERAEAGGFPRRHRRSSSEAVDDGPGLLERSEFEGAGLSDIESLLVRGLLARRLARSAGE